MPTRSQLLNPDYYAPILFNAVRILFILLFAYVATRAMARVIAGLRIYAVKMMLKSGGGNEFELEKRAETIGNLTGKALFVLIWVIAGLMMLKEMNFDVRPLLAGAGVAGVAIGFGAQNIIKDVLAGMFMMMENQIRVNDVAVINGKTGLVEEINLRTTVLRGEDGAVHIFPNGIIQGLTNLTREYSYYVFNLSIAYSDDTDRVVAVLEGIGAELSQEEPYRAAVLAPLEVLGVDKLADSGAVIKARFKTIPNQQWMVGREMNRRIILRFTEAKIALPSGAPTVNVVLPSAASTTPSPARPAP
ncbi:MAG TPA: mechanosensitive ion channel family protein [Bryobacteraceae bacterium]|nr:mechanosensitive ion channel family protein [Bryobacteraceae bacterium]